MKFTLQWLKDHIKTDASANEIAEKLTSLGIEVEEIIDPNKKFDKFIVGQIISAKKHPNADKLQVCEVDIGTKSPLNIVCGAPNARSGIYVVVALVGAVIPALNEPLKKGSIRGVESEGMMCSYDELLLSSVFGDFDGIIELQGPITTGKTAAEALGLDDIIFDVSLTPNRADCFSVRGIARDLSASGLGELIQLSIPTPQESFENFINIDISTESCHYFSTCIAKNISNKTPEYISKRLRAIGHKMIFAPVDIANYLCIDIGQPFHIFDLDKLDSGIFVRDARQGESLKTLDGGKDTIIPRGAVVVSNENSPLSIAGIIGGEETAFSKHSTNILIEAAYFDKVAIATAGQSLRITSDSRTRFERGIDPEFVDDAMKYIISILSIDSHSSFSNIKRIGEIPNNRNIIELTYKKFKSISGFSMSEFKMAEKILPSLGINIISMTDEKIIMETPSYRHDLGIEEDIIEEILRIIGYDNIKSEEISKAEPVIKESLSDKFSDIAVCEGFYEVKTFSFIDEKTASLFAKDANLLKITSPLSKDFSVLRPTILSSHLKSIKNNHNKSQKNCKFFEVGKMFFNNNGSVIEENIFAISASDKITNKNWRTTSNDVSIFDIKEILEKLFKVCSLNYRFSYKAPDYYHPGRKGAYITGKDTIIAYFGEVHPTILANMDIQGPVVYFEIFMDRLPEYYERKIKQPVILSQYQPITRAFSFIVSNDIASSAIIDSIKKLRIDFIRDISIFDIYESDLIGKNKKAIAFEVLMQSNKETLSEDKIKDASGRIIDSIVAAFDAVLRDQ